MSDESDWKEQTNMKKRQALKRKEKELFWKQLVVEIPHIITPQHAKKLQLTLNVDNLEQHFLSEEWIALQRNGWVYVKTFKSHKDSYTPLEGERLVPIMNKYGDSALFRRVEENM